jgi:DNA-binding MarR family transcriptional regulator
MPSNPDSYSSINKLIHEPARLSIMAVLSACAEADFKYLMNATALTKGNLSSHLARLEKAGYIAIQKKFVLKIPKTTVRLTSLGRKEFEEYTRQMREMMKKL